MKMKSSKAIWWAPSGASPIRASTDAATRNDAYSAAVRTKIWRPTRSIGRISASRGRFESACGRSSSTDERDSHPGLRDRGARRGARHAPAEAVDEQHLQDQVDDVRHDDDLERTAQVRDAAQVTLAGERDQRGRQPQRCDPEVEEREIARPSVRRRARAGAALRRLADDQQHGADRDRDPQRLRRQARGTLGLARAARTRDDGRRAVREEVEDRERAGEDRAGEPERGDLRPAQVADDRRVRQHVERLGSQRAERRQRQPQDLAVVARG